MDQIQSDFARYSTEPKIPEPMSGSHDAVDGGWAGIDDTLTTALPDVEHGDPDAGPRVAARRHRRRLHRRPWPSAAARLRWLRMASVLLVAVALTLVAMLSVLSGLISYQPLRAAASPGMSISGALTAWWPLLIYGPWLVASLSILRAAMYQRRSPSSWVVLVVFSGLAVGLCVGQAPPTVTGVAVVGLPPVSALAAFHQIVRQIPRINGPRHSRHQCQHGCGG